MSNPDLWSSLPDSEGRPRNASAPTPLARLSEWRDGVLLWAIPTVLAGVGTILQVLLSPNWTYRLGWLMWGLAGIASVLPPSRVLDLEIARPRWMVPVVLSALVVGFFADDLNQVVVGRVVFTVGALLLAAETVAHVRTIRRQTPPVR